VPLTLVVLDKFNFLDFYSNRTVANKEEACQKMFDKLQRSAYDTSCNVHGRGDYLRKIPCPKGQLCVDEDEPKNTVPGSQFTYIISDLVQPRFWYVSLVACYRNKTTCKWHHHDHDKLQRGGNATTLFPPVLNYDIMVVNGNPNQQQTMPLAIKHNPLTFHFSFDQQNTLEMYLILFVAYLILVPMQIYAVRIQKHPVTRLFTASLLLEFISQCLILFHLSKFAMNGVGNVSLAVAGDIFDIFSRTSFMLILLLLAKGWAVTRLEIDRLNWIVLMIIWIPYCIIHVVLYVWNRVSLHLLSILVGLSSCSPLYYRRKWT
jgi:Rhodopsin-like GPCR transmembrane domain